MTGFFIKLKSILSTMEGWISLAILGVGEYFAGHGVAITSVIVASVIDLIWAIIASVVNGDFALSKLMKETVIKLSIYASAIILFVGIDRIYDSVNPFVPLICTLICGVEFWSFSASALIVAPGFPVLRLMRKALTGEMASKLNCLPEEVEDILNKRKNV